MNAEAERQLIALEWHVWRELDRIHDEFRAKMDWLARSTGQRMRVK